MIPYSRPGRAEMSDAARSLLVGSHGNAHEVFVAHSGLKRKKAGLFIVDCYFCSEKRMKAITVLYVQEVFSIFIKQVDILR